MLSVQFPAVINSPARACLTGQKLVCFFVVTVKVCPEGVNSLRLARGNTRNLSYDAGHF